MKNKKINLLIVSAVLIFGAVYGISFLGTFFNTEISLLDELLNLKNLFVALALLVPISGYILIDQAKPHNKRYLVVGLSLFLLLSLFIPSFLLTGTLNLAVTEPAVLRLIAANFVSSLIFVPLVHFTVYSKK